MIPTQLRMVVLAGFAACVLIGAPATFAQKVTAEQIAKEKDPAWYGSADAKPVIDAVIAHQLPGGGWHKQYDLSKPDEGKVEPEWAGGTIDNGATYSELRILARAYNATKRQDVLDAFNKGLDFLLGMQYPGGGFPQRYPLREDYSRFITLNDNAMARVLMLMHDVVVNHEEQFAFVDAGRRAKANDAFARGVDCIVKLQFKRDGKLTAWGQQHDPETLQPAKARAYELPSLAADESAGILRVLMAVDDPSPDVKAAIDAGVAWFAASALHGIRTERKPDPSLPKGYDVYVVQDPNAPPIWARFYELDTNRPFFCGRDGVKKYKLEEIEPERRSGYAWLRPYGEKLPKEYAQWQKKHGATGGK